MTPYEQVIARQFERAGDDVSQSIHQTYRQRATEEPCVACGRSQIECVCFQLRGGEDGY